MDDVMRELGRRAIAAGWRWMPGVRAYDDLPFPMYARQIAPTDYGYGAEIEGHPDLVGSFGDPTEDWVPDFSDPATLGCLLAQVRERWQRGEAHASPNFRGGWNVLEDSIVPDCWPESLGSGQTEAAALVAALEAAPKGDA